MSLVTVDTLIVGAGPSGMACALTLQKESRECLVVEKRVYPRVKLCGGLFTFKAQSVLRSILGERPFEECMAEVVRSRDDSLSLWRRTTHIVSLRPMRPLVLIDRPAMDHFLVRHYKALGGKMLDGDALVAVDFQAQVATLASGQQIHYHHLVASDGANSTVERLLSASDPHFKRKKNKVATLEINVDKEDLAVDGVNIYFDIVPKTYAWAFSKGDKTCLGLGKMPGEEIDVNAVFRDFLSSLHLRRPERYPLRGAMIPYGQVAPEWCHGTVLFVGDSAGLVEPLTWEGIYYALRSGQMAGECLLSGRSYRREVASMVSHIRHGRFYQRLFEHPLFLNQFYRHGPHHTDFMARFYAENIDDIPRQSLLVKVLTLSYKILKHKVFDKLK